MASYVRSHYLDSVGELRRFLEPFIDECPLRGDLKLMFVVDTAQGSWVEATTEAARICAAASPEPTAHSDEQAAPR